MLDWQKAREHKRGTDRPSDWPDDVNAISMEGLSLFGIDSNHQLYWDGEPIQIRKVIDLSIWQRLAAFLLTSSAVVGAAAASASALADWLRP